MHLLCVYSPNHVFTRGKVMLLEAESGNLAGINGLGGLNEI